MPRRVIAFFTVLSILMCLLCYRVYNITQSDYAQVQRSGSTVTLTIDKSRGVFYDCNMQKLTNTQQQNIAAIVPTTQALAAIRRYFAPEDVTSLLQRLSKGKPITAQVGDDFSSASGTNVFKITKRYEQQQPAAHLIGYLDSGNASGIAGLEKVYNDWLTKDQSELSITYDVDASGRVLTGNKPVIENENYESKHGVQLTIDKNIQKIAEKASEKIPAGAIVVMEVKTGKLRAVVSTPNYDPNNISASLNEEGSPFLNRAFRGYSLGSIFKIVTAAAALENNIQIQEPYACTGSTTAGGKEFRCYQQKAHGEVSMETALEKSCNSYFINLALQIGREKLLAQAQKMGLGKENVLADGFTSAAGILPALAEIDSDAALANLAFGQGKLLVTPLQVAGVLASIANDGNYTEPSLIEGLIDENGQIAQKKPQKQSERMMSRATASILSRYLIHAMESNYSRIAMPVYGGAGGKTATAQSGWIQYGEEILHTWFAGFYPAQNPKYSIVIMNENGKFGASDCCPVFKEIVDGLYQQSYIK